MNRTYNISFFSNLSTNFVITLTSDCRSLTLSCWCISSLSRSSLDPVLPGFCCLVVSNHISSWSRSVLDLFSLRSRSGVAPVSICSRSVLDLVSLRSRSDLAPFSNWSRSNLELVSLCSRPGLASFSICSRSVLDLVSFRSRNWSRSVLILVSLRSRSVLAQFFVWSRSDLVLVSLTSVLNHTSRSGLFLNFVKLHTTSAISEVSYTHI